MTWRILLFSGVFLSSGPYFSFQVVFSGKLSSEEDFVFFLSLPFLLYLGNVVYYVARFFLSLSLSLVFFPLLIDFTFYSNFRLRAKLSGRYTDFPYNPFPNTCRAFPTITILFKSETFVKIDEPTMTHRYHPKSIVHIRSLLVLYVLRV